MKHVLVGAGHTPGRAAGSVVWSPITSRWVDHREPMSRWGRCREGVAISTTAAAASSAVRLPVGNILVRTRPGDTALIRTPLPASCPAGRTVIALKAALEVK